MVLLTSLGLTILINRQVESYAFSREYESVANLIGVARQSLETQYYHLHAQEQTLLQERKKQIADIIGISINIMETYHKKELDGELTRQQAQHAAKEEIREFRYAQGSGYISIHDTGKPFPVMIMHPFEPHFEGTVLKGERFSNTSVQGASGIIGTGENLFLVLNKMCESQGEGFIQYYGPQISTGKLVPKLGYGRLFKPWGWVSMTGAYIDDIEKDKYEQYQRMIVDLRQALGKVKLGQTGYMYVFDEDGQLVIHPTMTGKIPSITTVDGQPLLEALKAASHSEHNFVDYLWSPEAYHQPPQDTPPRLRRSYVAYFEPLGWYLCIATDMEELEQPVHQLHKFIIWSSTFFVLCALALTWWLSRNLAQPLQNLSQAIQSIERNGLSAAPIPVSGPGEIKRLGIFLEKMILSIQHSLQEKEALLDSLATTNSDLKATNSQLLKEVKERQRAQDMFDQAQKYIHCVIDSMPSVLVGVQRDGKITQWNHEAQKLTNITRQAAQDQDIRDVWPALGCKMEDVEKAIRSGNAQKSIKLCNQAEPGDGGKFYEITVYPLSGYQTEGAVIRIDDVSDRKHLEEMMVHSEKMLTVGGLAAGMAHEINNPLAGMMQNAQVILNRLSDKIPKNAMVAQECSTSLENIQAYMERRNINEMLESIVESGKRAARIVENMLGFSRKGTSKFVQTDVAELIDKTIELASNDYDLKKQYDFRSIQITKDCQEQPCMVQCDPSKLQQVFFNLLKNGAQAMRHNGTSGKQSQFQIRLSRTPSSVIIQIQDNGPGMDEQTRKRLFEPFFTTKRVGEGTGLGLSISYFIITESHHGHMSIESKPGHGANFVIELPLEQNA